MDKKTGAKKAVKAIQSPVCADTVDLFVYGTLMSDHHVQLLLHRKVETIPAVLNHYMKIVPKGGFAFIVKQTGASTEGRILKDLTREEIEKIDSFEDEGHLYLRRSVHVRIADSEERVKCMTYMGNISALNDSFWNEVAFEDRYGMFIEKKIDDIIAGLSTDRPEITRRVLRELMSSEADSIVQSHFEGNYVCNYIMVRALEEAQPPSLSNIIKENPEAEPYAGNYMRLACKHIVFNQLVELIRHNFPDAVRLSQQYFRHGLSILLAFMLYNRKQDIINGLFTEKKIDKLIPIGYRDYATAAVEISDSVFDKEVVREIIEYVRRKWYSTPTPLGAELEFSFLGANAVSAEPGQDKVYDGFYWFSDFDMVRRAWRLGGHVDSHRKIYAGQMRHRGFFEYALGRYQIVGDLSRPLFDCPWGLSTVINEAVKFLDIPPHSLHISMELPGPHSHITDKPHKDEDLACLLLLGGDLREDKDGKLREWRIYNNELDTNFMKSIHFSDRKIHFSKPGQDERDAANVMEYKFLRLHKEKTDYESVIVALKGYQFESHTRPVSVHKSGETDLPEQIFLRKWAKQPKAVTKADINSFLEKVEKGISEENKGGKLGRNKLRLLEKIEKILNKRNKMVESYEK